MHDYDQWDDEQTPFVDLDMERYISACCTCERHVTVTCGNRKELENALHYVRGEGIHGRCLKYDLPRFQLFEGDRMEPSQEVQDIGCIPELRAGESIDVVFWRATRLDVVKHNNPLFDDSIGMGPGMLLVDLLHAFNLGTLKVYCTDLVWELMLSCIWARRGSKTAAEYLQSVMGVMDCELRAWCLATRGDGEAEKRRTQIQELTSTTFGTANSRTLKLKVAETKEFFFPSVDVGQAQRKVAAW